MKNEEIIGANDPTPFILDEPDSICQTELPEGFVHIRDALGKAFRTYQNDAACPECDTAIKTGFPDIDMSGIYPDDLVYIGSRPGMGKTALALNIAVHAAQSMKKTFAVFSLDLSCAQVTARLLSATALVEIEKLSGHGDRVPSPDDWQSLADAASHLHECNIIIDDTPALTVADMREKLKHIDSVGLVVIDYLQLIEPDDPTDDRARAVGKISRSLKLLAQELRVPVICCTQLGRGLESGHDKRPKLSDLRRTGTLESDADMIMFLYRDDYYKTDGGETQDAELIIAKNRRGFTCDIDLLFFGKCLKFVGRDEDE